MSKDNQGAIFIASFSEQLIREDKIIPVPDHHPSEFPINSHGYQFWYIEWEKYKAEVASRRTFSYPVKEEQDGKELRECKEFRFEHWCHNEPTLGGKHEKVCDITLERYATQVKCKDCYLKAIPIEPEPFDVKDGIIQGLEEGAEAWKAEYDNCRAILEGLVRLKILKDQLDETPKENEDQEFVKAYAQYIVDKKFAWLRAKEFLKTYQHGYE